MTEIIHDLEKGVLVENESKNFHTDNISILLKILNHIKTELYKNSYNELDDVGIEQLNQYNTQIKNKKIALEKYNQELNALEELKTLEEKALEESKALAKKPLEENKDTTKQTHNKNIINTLEKKIKELQDIIATVESEIKTLNENKDKLENKQKLYERTKQSLEGQQKQIKENIVASVTDNKNLDTQKWTSKAMINKANRNLLTIYADIFYYEYGVDAEEKLKEVAKKGLLGSYMQSNFEADLTGRDKLSQQNLRRTKLLYKLDEVKQKHNNNPQDQKAITDYKNIQNEIKNFNDQIEKERIDYLLKNKLSKASKRRIDCINELTEDHKFLVQEMKNGTYGSKVKELANKLQLKDQIVERNEHNRNIIDQIVESELKVDEIIIQNSDNDTVVTSNMDYQKLAIGGTAILTLISLFWGLSRDTETQQLLLKSSNTMGQTLGDALLNNLGKLVTTASILGYSYMPPEAQKKISEMASGAAHIASNTLNPIPTDKNGDKKDNTWDSYLNQSISQSANYMRSFFNSN